MGVDVSGVPKYSPKAMRIWIVLVVSWTTFLAFAFVALRLWSRRIRKQRLWWDDYMILFSMVRANPKDPLWSRISCSLTKGTLVQNRLLTNPSFRRSGIGLSSALGLPCSSKELDITLGSSIRKRRKSKTYPCGYLLPKSFTFGICVGQRSVCC